MRSMHSAQRKVELRRLGNHLPVLGNANSFCKMVKLCVFCLFVKLWLSLGRVGTRDKDIPDFFVTVAKSVYHLDDVLKYQLHPLVVGGNTNSAFLCFFVFLFADVDTYVLANLPQLSLCRYLLLLPTIYLCKWFHLAPFPLFVHNFNSWRS